jgi:hypothetical protein
MLQKEQLKSLAIAIAKEQLEKKFKGGASAAKKKAVQQAFSIALNGVIARKMQEKRQAFKSAHDLWEAPAQDEGFMDGLAALGSVTGHAIGHAVAKGLGVSGKSVAKVIRAFRKKKNGKEYQVSKVPAQKKSAHTPVHAPAHPAGHAGSNVVKMDRKEFSKKLKAAGNNTRKVSLS